MAAPNKMPPANPAMNPFPPIATAPSYASNASARMAICSDTPEVHPRSLAKAKSFPPMYPTTTAATIASPICLSASSPHALSPIDSSAAAAAMKRVTSGVAIPSLRPLSTLSARRIRTGTALLVTTARPSAASVGARMAAINAAAAHPTPGNMR